MDELMQLVMLAPPRGILAKQNASVSQMTTLCVGVVDSITDACRQVP